MGFSRQEYWRGLPCPPPGNFPNPGTEPVSLVSPALQAGSLSSEPSGKPLELPYNPAILLAYIHIEETRTERHTCTPMFTAALLTIARTWKQPRCPLEDKWIRKLWYIYTMEYCSAIKKNAFESVLMKWMKLEPIIQSEVSQKKNTNTVY